MDLTNPLEALHEQNTLLFQEQEDWEEAEVVDGMPLDPPERLLQDFIALHPYDQATFLSLLSRHQGKQLY